MSSAELIFTDGLLGFEVDRKSRLNATSIVEGVPDGPSAAELAAMRKAAAKRAAPPPRPQVDVEALKKEILAEAQPRIEKETEERVWREAEVKYKQDLAKEISLIKVAQQEEMAAEHARRSAMLNHLQLQFDQFVRDLRAEIAEEVVVRSVDIAELLMRHALPDRAMLLSLLKSTLEPITDLQGAKIRINPDDLKLLKDAEDLEIPYDGQFEWATDTSLQPGELVIESRNGIFDASIDQRIALLKEQLRQRVGKLHGTVSTIKN